MRDEVRELIEILAEVFRTIHQRSYHKMDNKNLYPGQPKLLSLIKAHEGITQKELSQMNFVKPATITGMLSKLEANHYVYRMPDEVDKRIMRVYLTPEGRRLAEKGELFMVSMIDKLFDGFDEEELRTFLSLTRKLRNNLHKNEK
jgi:DNA-binding MarR family transcriptional regulator